MAIGTTPLGRMAIEVDLDSSSLRKNTTNMKNLMKSVNEEFKANMSAVKRTGSEMDILATRTNGLSKKYEAQKKVVEEMTKAYEKANEQASSDKATQKQIKDAEAKKRALNKEIAALNDLEGALKDAQREQDELAEHNKKLESSFYRLDEAMKANGDKLKNFGSITSGIGRDMFTKLTLPILGVGAAAVKSAGDYDAAESQFSQVFGKMESTASSSLEKISKETGLLPNSLRGSFTQIAAFAKTTGADTKTALDITSRATLAAADSAAFYDRSIEEVTESLQSYLKGNFENDAALGISSTETTRNAEANKLYGKSFKDLNEEQKQLTLLSMVEEGNKLSGALGQAARESDQLGTQTSNLKTVIKDLLNEIGKPILPIVIQGFKSLTGAIKQGIGWFSKLDESKKAMIIGLAGIVAAIPPVLIGIGLIAQGLGSIMTLGAPLALTITAVVAVLALLAIGLTRAYKNSETFRNVVNGAFSVVKKGAESTFGVVKGLFQLFKGDGSKGVLTLNKFLPPNIVEGLKKTVDSIKKIFSDMGKAVSGSFKQIGSMLLKFWKENGTMIVQALQNFMVIIKPVLTIFKVLFGTAFKVTFLLVKTIVVGTFNAVIGVIKGAVNVILGIVKVFSAIFTGNWRKLFEGLWQICKGLIQIIWNGINLLFYGRIIKGGVAFAKSFTKIFPSLWNNVKNIFFDSIKGIYNFVTKIWSNLHGTSTKILTNMYKSLWKILTNLRKSFSDIFNAIWNKTKDIFNSILKFAPNAISKTKDGVVDGLRKMKSNLDDLMDRMKKKVADSFSNMVDGAKALPGKLGDGIRNGAGKAVDGIKHLGSKMIDKLGGVVNGTIGGINTVTEKLGIGKKLKEWSPPRFSTGTKNGALASDSLITVGDKGKGNWKGTRELVQFPNGKMRLFNKETTFHAPAGTKVFSNYETEHMLNPIKFSTGTGGGVGEFFSGIGKSIVNGFGELMDFMDNPKAFAEKMINGIVKKTGFGGLSNFALDLAKGSFNKVKEATINFISKMFEESSDGGGDGSSFTKFDKTTPYSPNSKVAGYGYNGGLHFGIDYATPIGTILRAPTSGTVERQDNYGGGIVAKLLSGKFTQFFLHLQKVLKTGHVNKGEAFAKTGNSGRWTTGPHLHYQVERGHSRSLTNRNTVDPEKFLAGIGGAKSNSKGDWTGTVRRALSLAGLPTNQSYVNAWLRQIQTESGGNPNAVGGTDGLNEGRATGLVQVKLPTFNANALQGMTNIFNPLHNLVAGMRYAKARYGGSMLSVIGQGHGYKTGGIVTGKQLAWLDEENKGEVVIPLNPSRRSDAMKLLAYTAMKIMPKERGGEGYRPNIPNVNIDQKHTESNIVKMLAQIVKNQQEQLDRIEEQTKVIKNKKYSIDKYAHEKEVVDVIEKHERTKSRIKRF